MLGSNEFFVGLKQQLLGPPLTRILLIVLTAAVFPIAEGVLTETWSSATTSEAKKIAWTALIVIASIHIILFVVLLIIEFRAPELLLASAAEVKENATERERELQRRSTTYRMVRECLILLTRKTCDLPRHGEPQVVPPQANEWCQEGFEIGLKPIVDVVLENIMTTLGVRSTQFTFEIHIYPEYIDGVEPIPEHNGFCLRFFSSPIYQRTVVQRLTNNAPCRLGEAWDIPNQQHIADSRALFYENDMPSADVYFRRFATCPITESCSETRMGVLVVTSMQDDSLAADVLDTMQFVSSIISNYVSAFSECYSDREQLNAVRAIIGKLQPEDREELLDAFNLTDPGNGDHHEPIGAPREQPDSSNH